MLGLFLDAFVVCGIAYLLNQGETEGLGTGILSGLAISFAAYLSSVFIHPLVGIAALLLAAFFVFWAVFHLTPLKALLGAGILFVYKIAISVAFVLLFST